MSDIKDGGPAFPGPVNQPMRHPGMSLLDYFAGQALASLLTNEFVRQEIYAYAKTKGLKTTAALAEQAWVIADAMLAEREAK